MRKFSELVEEALKASRERIDTLKSFETIISTANNLAKEYEDEDGIEHIAIGYPNHGGDYLLITIYLTEKGRIMKDVGSFIDSFVNETGCDYDDDVIVDPKNQTKKWNFIHKNRCFKIRDNIRNPRTVIMVDASKSKTCKRVPTGETVPVYEFICEEE